MSCYLVQESDGTSRFTLEDGTGFLLLEFCPPAGTEYNPVGDNPEARRARRRRMEYMLQEEEEILAILSSLD